MLAGRSSSSSATLPAGVRACVLISLTFDTLGRTLGDPVDTAAAGVIKCAPDGPGEARSIVFTDGVEPSLRLVEERAAPVVGECVAVNARSHSRRHVLFKDFKSGWISHVLPGKGENSRAVYQVTRPGKPPKARTIEDLRCFEKSACPVGCTWHDDLCVFVATPPEIPPPPEAFPVDPADNGRRVDLSSDEDGMSSEDDGEEAPHNTYGPTGLGNLVGLFTKNVHFRPCTGHEPVINECVGVKTKKKSLGTSSKVSNRKFRVSVLAGIINGVYLIWQPSKHLKEKGFDDLVCFSPPGCPADCKVMSDGGVERCLRDF